MLLTAQVTVSSSLAPESSYLEYVMTWLWVFFSRPHEGCEGSSSRSRIRRLSGWDTARVWGSEAGSHTAAAGSASTDRVGPTDL